MGEAMLKTTELCKLVLIIDSGIQDRVLKKLVTLGVSGYTCIPCFGEGHRSLQGEPFMGVTQLMVQVITKRDLAVKIIADFENYEFAAHPGKAFIEPVEVVNPDQFINRKMLLS